MFIDIIRPANNEAEFFQMAERLGIKGLALLDVSRNRVKELQSQTTLKLVSAGKADADIIVKSINDNGQANILTGLYHHEKHSFYKELSKRNTALSFPIAEIISSDLERKHHLLENLMRNIRLCREHNTKIAPATFASNPFHLRPESDLKSLFLSSGMGTKEAKVSFGLVSDLVKA